MVLERREKERDAAIPHHFGRNQHGFSHAAQVCLAPRVFTALQTLQSNLKVQDSVTGTRFKQMSFSFRWRLRQLAHIKTLTQKQLNIGLILQADSHPC